MSQKREKYKRLFKQLKVLLDNSPSLYSQMATINAVLYHKIPDFFWVGFYFLKNHKLIIGPYQGPLACQVLEYPKGVCWKAVLDNAVQIVPDVNKFKDHIACDSRSKSEMVIPLNNINNEIVAVMDIDSNKPDQFDHCDAEEIAEILSLLNLSDAV